MKITIYEAAVAIVASVFKAKEDLQSGVDRPTREYVLMAAAFVNKTVGTVRQEIA